MFFGGALGFVCLFLFSFFFNGEQEEEDGYLGTKNE